MCSIEAHGKNQKSVNEHKPINGDTSSGVVVSLTSNSTE